MVVGVVRGASDGRPRCLLPWRWLRWLRWGGDGPSGHGGVEFLEEGAEAGCASGGVLGQPLGENRSQSSWQRVQVGLVGEVSIEDFGGGFSLERHMAGEQFVDDCRGAVDIDFGSVFPA